MGIGDWGLGMGDWGLGPIPNPQSPIPNPHNIKSINLIKINKINIIILTHNYFITNLIIQLMNLKLII